MITAFISTENVSSSVDPEPGSLRHAESRSGGHRQRAYCTIRANSSGSRRRAAHQPAVDLGHRHQLGDVPRLHAAAVEDAQAVGQRRRRADPDVLAGSRRSWRWRRRGWRCGRCRSPRSARRRRRSGPRRRPAGAANAASIWPSTFASVAPASRSSSVSPTHMIGVMPAASTARSFLATISSVSPNSSRRSEWPTITYLHVELGEHRRADLAGERARRSPSDSSARRARSAAGRRRSSSAPSAAR